MNWTDINNALPAVNQKVVVMDHKGDFYAASYDHHKNKDACFASSWIFTLNPGRHKIGSIVRWTPISYSCCNAYENYRCESK